MKQPDLGKRLAELRKQKGMTQEELVARCNVTVRTIQRIEAGEVTPRASTLRLIVEALDYNWENFSSDADSDTIPFSKPPIRWTQKVFPFNEGYLQDDRRVSRHLQMAWIAGIIYFIAGFPEGAMEFLMIDGDLFTSENWYVAVKVIVLVSFIFFIRGFILVSKMHQQTLLTFSSWLYLFVVVFDYSIELFFPFETSGMMELPVAKGLAYGSTAVLFGISLFRARRALGDVAHYAGLLEIAVGLSFLTLIFFLVGIVLMVPAELLEIYLLFKCAEQSNSKLRTEESPAPDSSSGTQIT